GQSNMSGTTNPLVSQLPTSLLDSVPNVLIKVDEHKVNYNWGPLCPGLGATASNFGPEITFGRDALDYFGCKIAIIKFSFGGTTLNEDWRPPSSAGTVGWLYSGLINDVTACLAHLDSSYEVHLMGMCWMQGETDALDNAKAVNYQINLINFIHDIRTALNFPKMPFCIGMIDSSAGWTYNTAVRQGEINVAKSIDGVSIFDTHGLETDGVHYSTQGQIELGHFFFRYLDGSYASYQSYNEGTTKVFPNPSNGSFQIITSGIPTEYKYIIIDKKGALVQAGQLYIGCEVNIPTLNAGVYFIYLTTKQGTVVKKIVKE
ncbi:MAG TPA: sialate O-acetylesterase, partial [Bacteroidia bacterium]